jgi:DNA polymerase III delta prime subunit
MRKYDNTGDGDQINIENVGQYNAAPSAPRNPVLAKLLGVVKQEIKERLAQSLHQAVEAELLNLGKVLEPCQVCNPWTMEMSAQERPSQQLSSEMTIAQVFELSEVGQKLLILGEPGSGKTITLLELAQSLVEKALKDSDAPIPMLVNLSSWKDSQQPFFDWLVGKIKSKYGVRQELGRQFLIQNQLLPFLDGLDEVPPGLQESCALGLNAWLTGDMEQQPIGAVVCCRRKEYEEIVCKRLVLQNSVELQPLNDRQIETYLTQLQLGTVRECVQASPQLQDLLRKPLFLAVFGFVAPQFDFSEWQRHATDAERMEYLFDRYWDAAMDKALLDAKSQDQGVLSKTYDKRILPHRKKVRRAIVFAAKAMEQESQTELLIEKIQPTWLQNKRQQLLYQSIVGLNGGLIAGLIGGLIGGLTVGLIVALTVGMVGVLKADIEPVEAIKISISRQAQRETLSSLRKNLIVGLMVALTVGLTVGLSYWLSYSRRVGLMVGLSYGIGLLMVMLSVWLIRGLKADIEDRISPNQGIKNSRQNVLLLTGTALLTAILFKLLLEHLLAGKISPLEISFIVSGPLIPWIWLSFYEGGGLALCQHIALRIVFAWNGYAPYRYDKLLDYCTERLLLQRIGGRYRFMHKLLQEHFAKMSLD